MNKIKQIILLTLIVGFVFSCKDRDEAFRKANPKAPETMQTPKKEIRAVWFTTVWNLDIPKLNPANINAHKKHYTDMLDELKALNFNAVIAQVRPKADAFWKSDLEPWSTWLAGLGVEPGYDPLAFWIEEAHKRGMELHAWVNPYDITSNKSTFTPAPGSVAAVHPEWTMEYPNDVYTRIMFRPSHPEVPKYLVKVIKEIADNYDIDGVHFDDYFYPYPENGAVLDDAKDFADYGAGYASIDDFRRACVNSAIEQVSNMLKTHHPNIRFSISPFTDGPYNYSKLYADLPLWSKKGWVDFIVPQLYNGTSSITSQYPFETQFTWWVNNTVTPVAAGLPIYRVNSGEYLNGKMDNIDLAKQLLYVYSNRYGIGTFHYKAGDIISNVGNLQEVLKIAYEKPALIPLLGRTTLPKPDQVTSVAVQGNKLIWAPAGGGSRYAVYRADNNSATLEAITEDIEYILKEAGTYYVSAVNKENNEGKYSDMVEYK